jgi:hypothetical protein
MLSGKAVLLKADRRSVAKALRTEYAAIQELKNNLGFQLIHEYNGQWNLIDNLGAADSNRTAFRSVRLQYRALWQFRLAILRGVLGSDYLLRATTAFEYGFAKQSPIGFFTNGEGVAPTVAIEGDTFFMGAYADAYLLIRAAPNLDYLLPRYKSHESVVVKSLTWLSDNIDHIITSSAQTPNRALFAAVCFYLNGVRLHNSAWKLQGLRLYNTALDLLHPTGYFLEKGGYDSSYQGVSLFNMCYLFFACTDLDLRQRIKSDIAQACDWLITRVLQSGEISTVGNTRTGPDGELGSGGKVKEVNYTECALALYYCSYILDSPELILFANKVTNYWHSNIQRTQTL